MEFFQSLTQLLTLYLLFYQSHERNFKTSCYKLWIQFSLSCLQLLPPILLALLPDAVSYCRHNKRQQCLKARNITSHAGRWQCWNRPWKAKTPPGWVPSGGLGGISASVSAPSRDHLCPLDNSLFSLHLHSAVWSLSLSLTSACDVTFLSLTFSVSTLTYKKPCIYFGYPDNPG